MHPQVHLGPVYVLTKARLLLAQVQSRLERHLEAWSTLIQALHGLQSLVLAQALASHADDTR